MQQKKWKKTLLIVGFVFGLVILCAGIGISLSVGKQVANGLVYMNQGNDTKQNSIMQLKEWGFNLEEFEANYVALFFVMLFVFIVGQFNPISEGGYRDIFLSFTVPYVIGACVYYIDVCQTAKKQNELLDKIKKSVENDKKRE